MMEQQLWDSSPLHTYSRLAPFAIRTVGYSGGGRTRDNHARPTEAVAGLTAQAAGTGRALLRSIDLIVTELPHGAIGFATVCRVEPDGAPHGQLLADVLLTEILDCQRLGKQAGVAGRQVLLFVWSVWALIVDVPETRRPPTR